MAGLPLHLQGDLEGRYRIERELVTLADRFVSEIRLTAALQHPHILAVLEYYREFLRRVDRPTPRYRPQLEEAREALRFAPQ